MEVKLEREWSREELADYLTTLAAQIRQGELHAAGIVQKLPAQAATEIFIKEKKGRLIAKINLIFSTLEHYSQPRREAVQQVVENFKVVKKRLGMSFVNLKKSTVQGKLPEEPVLLEFLSDCQAFAQQADPEWQAEMAIYLGHIKNLEQSYKVGNLEMFQHEMADLKASMARCHQDFK